MSSNSTSLLQQIRVFGTRFFHRFGIHCATHQTRVILISSVVISCLLFPAVALYSSAQTSTFSISFRVFDALLTPDDISTYFALDDLRNLWQGHDTLRTREDSTARARCGKEGIVRVERIIVHDGLPTDEDETMASLNRRILLSTSKFERRLSELLGRAPCIRSPQGRCLVLSPLAFWDYDENAISADPTLFETLDTGRNTSIDGLTATSDMVLAGREDRDGPLFDESVPLYPVLTYFFPEADCIANGGHHLWLNIVEEAASGSGAEVIVVSKAPRLIALEHKKEVSAGSRLSVLSVFTYTAYLIFLVYFSRMMRRMDTVHSRIGLAFTGIVEIVVSTVTSLSVCALVGFRITMVPWEIFPIVVIFIGVENMFSIVDAVVKTSIALPVKERIAEGLGRAGTSNTLKLCSYNSVLGVIAFFSTGAIRQFCAFAIVVLVAHWFLVHTFFVTVLSIDIQRLELDELLRQNTSLAPSLGEKVKSHTSRPRTRLGRIMAGIHHIVRGRPAKNISLVLLLAVTATLYYMTQPQSSAIGQHDNSFLRNHRNRIGKQATGITSPAMQVWQTLNPNSHELVHLRIESPTIVVLNSDGAHSGESRTDRQHMLEYEKTYRSRWSRLWIRTARPLAWAFNIIAVPTFVTTTLLYGLLLYLLKDAELLEAQRNRVETDSPIPDEAIPAVDDPVSFTTLPRAFATDVDLLAASADGSVVATVGLQNEFVLWRPETQTYFTVDTRDILLGGSGSSSSVSSTLTAISVNDRGTYVAAGTGTGIIAIWYIGQNRVQPLLHLNADTYSPVTNIQFLSKSPSPGLTGRSTPRRVSGATQGQENNHIELAGNIYATYDNGTALKWSVGFSTTPTSIKPTRSASIIKSVLSPVQANGRLFVGFCLEDGSLELCDVDAPEGPPRAICIMAGNPADLVDKFHVCSVDLEGETRNVIGAATQAGVISLWDGGSGECMYILDEPYGSISALRVTPVPIKRCPTCRELAPESFSLCFSFGQVVLFYRAYLSLPTRRCSCPLNQPKMISSVLGRRSRSSSVASVVPSPGTSSPAHVRSRISSFSSNPGFDPTSMYPVSAHGVHSRRTSDKRNLDAFIPAETDEFDGRQPVGPPDVINPASSYNSCQQRSSLWQNLVVVCTADATFERGSWDVANNKIVGIRRKPRMLMGNGNGAAKSSSGRSSSGSQVRPDSTHGLTPATLERWELWMFDPSESRLQASPLLALDAELKAGKGKTKSNDPTHRNPILRRTSSADVVPRLHFTRVSPLFSSRSFCLAGFGNTVGLFNFGGAGARQRPSLEHLRMSSGSG